MLQRGRKGTTNLAVFPGPTLRDHIAAPSNLSAAERLTVEQLVVNAGSDHFTKNDAPLLAGYVQALGLMQHYAEKARNQPSYVKHHNQACKSAALLATKLRLAPSSRMSPRVAARVAEKRGNVSAYDLMDDHDD